MLVLKVFNNLAMCKENDMLFIMVNIWVLILRINNITGCLKGVPGEFMVALLKSLYTS